jgi:hypothetical protein
VTALEDFYAREADRLARGPQVYGGNASVASLRCFRRYHKDARFEYVDRAGFRRWMTPTMMRIEAVILRIGSVGSGYTKTAQIAAEAKCSAGYVSKMLSRFEAWGEIGLIRTRGRFGKLFIFARSAGDKLDHYMEEAKRRIHAQKVRGMARAMRRAGNVSSRITRRGQGSTNSSTSGVTMEETFTGFAREVIHERARLALDDPDGERESVAPLTQERAQELWNMTQPVRYVRRNMSPNDDLLGDSLGISAAGKGMAHCPAHEDPGKSLSWRWAENGRLLLHCFAGCTFDEIKAASRRPL